MYGWLKQAMLGHECGSLMQITSKHNGLVHIIDFWKLNKKMVCKPYPILKIC